MALKNRDGTPYKLRGPNPMMKGQETWQDFQVHNMKFQPETALDDREIKTMDSDFNVRDDFAQALAETKPDIVVNEQRPAPVEEKPSQPIPEVKEEEPVKFTPEPEQPRKKSSVPDKNKTFMYCLPATMRDRRDSMYGEKYQTIQYGKPFSFEGVILGEEDMRIVIWTNVPLVTKGSIVYPKRRRDGVMDAHRWWRVQELEEKNDGWLMAGYPSDFTPAFDNVT